MTMPDHGQVRRYYDDEYYGRQAGGDSVPWHVRRVAGRIGDLRGKAVLDIACGSGTLLLIAEKNPHALLDVA